MRFTAFYWGRDCPYFKIPVGFGSCNIDSHNCQRIVQGDYVRNEGDVQALPGAITLLGGVVATNLLVQAIADSIPEGDKVLTLTLQPGAGYSLGALSNCTVRVLDLPFDAW